MSNAFDEFDAQQPNPFDDFDQRDAPSEASEPTPTDTFFSNLSRFGGNLFQDAKDVATGFVAPIANPNLTYKAMSDLMYNDEGEYSTEGMKKAGSAIVDRASEIISDPGGSLYDRPISTLMDVATVAMPTRAASLVARPINEAASNVLSKTATVIDNIDPINAAATGTAAYQSRVSGQERMEEILKPSLSETDMRMKPDHRERVINSALDRGIMPTEAGMGKMYAQIRDASERADEMIMGSDAIITVDEIASRIRHQADLVPDSDKNAGKLRKAIEDEAKAFEERYAGREILGAEELRELRRSGDETINHNRLYKNGEPVRVQADKVYANTLRGVLSDKVDGLREVNSELSDLYDIADMYIKPTQRLRNNNQTSLPQQLILGNGPTSVGGGTLAAHLFGLDPMLGAAGGLLATGLSHRINNPAIRMGRAQRSHDVAQNGLLFRDAGKYKPASDIRYSSLLINDLMEQQEDEE